jgi:hypothetical protein
MSVNDLVVLLFVAAGAFYAGYQFGRLKVLAERGETRAPDADQPLPGPRLDRPYSEPRPKAAPPPASAGNDGAWPDARGDTASGRAPPPRRSSKPPPAAAGLMGTGEADKSDKRQK